MMRKLLLPIIFLGVFSSCSSLRTASSNQLNHSGILPLKSFESIAIYGVNIIPMNTDGIVKNMVVFIDDGRIEKIRQASEIKIKDLEPKYKVIDGSEKYLIPGLVDSHVHLGYRAGVTELYLELALFIANGVTSVRNMAGTPQILKIRDQIRDRKIVGPNIFSTGPIYNGAVAYKGKDNSDWCFRGNRPGKCALKTKIFARHRVNEDKKLGYDGIKPREYLSKEVYLALSDEAKKRKIRLMGHYPSAVPYKEMFANKYQHSIEHAAGLGHLFQSKNFPFNSKSEEMVYTALGIRYIYSDKTKENSFLEDFSKSGIFFVPSLIQQKNFKKEIQRASGSKKESTDFISNCKLAEMEKLNPIYLSLKKWLNVDGKDFVQSGYSAVKKFVYRAWKAGVPIVVGTDTNAGGVISGFSVHEELKELVQSGIPEQEALKAATMNAAKMLGWKQSGVVQEGAIADLIVLDENPLDSIDATRKINSVITRGRHYSRSDLNKALKLVKQKIREMECRTGT